MKLPDFIPGKNQEIKQIQMQSNHRNRFVKDLFGQISRLRYAALRIIDPLTDFNEGELKILIDSSQYQAFLGILSTCHNIRTATLLEKPFSSIITINFYDHSSIELDIIKGFVRKGVVFMNAQQVLNSVLVNNDGIKVPLHCFNFEYVILSHLLNGVNVADKYRKFFEKLSREERTKIFQHIRQKYYVVINVLDDLYTFEARTYNQLRTKILKMKQNNPLLKFLRDLQYIPWFFMNLYHRNKIKITFSPSMHTVVAEANNAA